ncbi:MAG: hypothetical protein ACLQVL_25455 [Terriglobia bacterium]
MRLPPLLPFVLAIYKSDDGKSAVVWVCDLPLASSAGAALTLVPAAVAEESVRAGKLTDVLSENIYEIFNVCTALFNQPNRPHFVLGEVAAEAPNFSAAMLASMAKPHERDDFEVSINGYGSGKLTSWAISLE